MTEPNNRRMADLADARGGEVSLDDVLGVHGDRYEMEVDNDWRDYGGDGGDDSEEEDHIRTFLNMCVLGFLQATNSSNPQ